MTAFADDLRDFFRVRLILSGVQPIVWLGAQASMV